MLHRHGTCDGWTKHTTWFDVQVTGPIIDHLRLTQRAVHHVTLVLLP